jgi:uncharacterized SAM-binding protein YcdF (DUF218 family)
LLDVAKEQLHLSSPLAVVLLLAVAVVWLWRRPTGRAPRWYLAIAFVGYWLVTTSVGASFLSAPLGREAARVTNRTDAMGADTVVLLGGGVWTADVDGTIGGTLPPQPLLRALEAARVFKAIDARLVIASGGIAQREGQVLPESVILRDALVRAGVPPSSVLEESRSTTTHEQAVYLAPVLRERQAGRFVLVTSRDHMRRALAVFRKMGLDPIPSIPPQRSDAERPPRWFMPNPQALQLSDAAVYEYAATVYYKARGWM